MHDPTKRNPVLGSTQERIPCPHADLCSGCPLIDHPYTEQLVYKRDRLSRAIALYQSLAEAPIDPLNAAEPRTGYRTRAKLIVAPGPRIGLYAKGGGHVVVDIPECRVMSPALLEVAARLRDLLASPPAAAGVALIASDRGSSGALSAVDLREIDGEAAINVLVTLVVDVERRPSHGMLSAAAAAVKTSAPLVAGVAASFRPQDSPQVLGSPPRVISGPAATSDSLAKSPLYQMATYGSFAQAHRTEAGRIRELVIGQIAARTGSVRNQRVLDLYGGSGTTSLLLVQSGAHATLVDSFAPATEGARRAAHDQGLPNIDVRIGDAARVAPDLARNGERFDAVVANPPRSGIAPRGRKAIAELGPAAVVYVSCDPDSLARDLDHFSRLGYRTHHLYPFDLLPMTDHVETVAVLGPAPAPPPRVAYEDDALLIVEKAPFEAVSGPDGSALIDRIAKRAGGGATVPVSSLPPGASGLVVLAKSKAIAGAIAPAVRSAACRSTFIIGVRGITARTGTIRSSESRARYRRIAVIAGHSVVSIALYHHRALELLRGFAQIGHHVLGDGRFGHPSTNRHFEQKYCLCRPFLHCARVHFDHPETGLRVTPDAPLPGDLVATLERMGANRGLIRALSAGSHLEHAPAAD
jgi:23S rRNA (uracil1939-C5)-methyltransferase